ncbi:hypothetical protein KGY79_13265 [Candidatus Bipolaricaulota bacterium]|nr:hypothetical protein [Candidatus Bipolaricaulota bacterium]
MHRDKIKEISQYLNIDQDSLIEKGVESLLTERKRELMVDRYELLSRYNVSNLDELEKKIESGDVKEHPTWEDLITLENLDEAITRLNEYQKQLHQAA